MCATVGCVLRIIRVLRVLRVLRAIRAIRAIRVIRVMLHRQRQDQVQENQDARGTPQATTHKHMTQTNYKRHRDQTDANQSAKAKRATTIYSTFFSVVSHLTKTTLTSAARAQCYQ